MRFTSRGDTTTYVVVRSGFGRSRRASSFDSRIPGPPTAIGANGEPRPHALAVSPTNARMASSKWQHDTYPSRRA
eukprot:158108-Prymnesium_polylepis.1